MEIKVGIKGKAKAVVTVNNTAQTVGSGSLPVFATPAMTALMEKASCAALNGCLQDGSTTVGTKIDIEHISATPIGMEVTAESTVIAVDGRKVSFEVMAFDEAGLIGKGVHERFIVDAEKFTAKTAAKKHNI